MALIHIVAVISLLGTFMVLAGHLFTQSMRITRDAGRQEHELVQIDALLRHLRRDVWQAASLTADDPHRLEVARHDGHRVLWQIEPGEGEAPTRITREVDADGADDRPAVETLLLRRVLHFDADTARARLHAGDRQWTLVSQHRLLEESR